VTHVSVLGAALALALVVLVASPVAGAIASPTRGAPGGAAGPPLGPDPADGVVAEVTWGGTDVTAAGSATRAFVLDAGSSADVDFNYTESAGTPAVDNATLTLVFAGVTLSTESIRATTVGLTGGAALTWTFGNLVYLTEGVYEMYAELLDRNGSVLFQQPFFVDVRAPYLVGSVILDMAIVLGIVEALWIRSVVRYRRGHRGRYRYR